MERVDYLPLGSVVVVQGAIKKTMIIARGLAAELNGTISVFDYGGCLYPEGIVGDQIVYFNHQDIAKVVFEGLSDEDDAMMVENINTWLQTIPYERGNPQEINQAAQAESNN